MNQSAYLHKPRLYIQEWVALPYWEGIKLVTRLFPDKIQAKTFRARLQVTHHSFSNAPKNSCRARVTSMASQHGHVSTTPKLIHPGNRDLCHSNHPGSHHLAYVSAFCKDTTYLAHIPTTLSAPLPIYSAPQFKIGFYFKPIPCLKVQYPLRVPTGFYETE